MPLSNEDMRRLFYTPMIPSNVSDKKFSLSYMLRFVDEYANKTARNVLAERPSGTPGSTWEATAAEMTTDQQPRIVAIAADVAEIKSTLQALLDKLGDRAEGDGNERPAQSDRKAAWVDYAVTHGMDREQAEDMTKDELIERHEENDDA